MTTRQYRRSPLAMVVLAVLTEGPMHPYRMQQLIKERHRHAVVNVTQRNSVYQAIERLQRVGLVSVQQVTREQRRPERTTYQITADGRRTLRSWLTGMLAAPTREYPEFPAALAFLPLLSPDEAATALASRIDDLTAQLSALDAEPPPPGLPRLFLAENEYRRAVARAELNFVRALHDDLRTGQLTWSTNRPRSTDGPWSAEQLREEEPGAAG